MKPYQKADGNVLLSGREYDIAENTVIKIGQLVKLNAGLVVSVAAGESGQILGIAAEDHSGAADALDPRADGSKIMVWDDPDMIMQCAAPKFTATGGTVSTVTTADLGSFAAGDFNGGYIKLVAKGEDSTNTDAIGTVKRVESFAYSGGTSTFTVGSGAAASEGDVYQLFPPIGFKKGNLDADRRSWVATATANLSIKCVGHDRELGKLNYMAHLHVLGAED